MGKEGHVARMRLRAQILRPDHLGLSMVSNSSSPGTLGKLLNLAVPGFPLFEKEAQPPLKVTGRLT